MNAVSRRRFLRGFGGVALGLPFLETFAPSSLKAQEAEAIKRFGVFFACNGVNMDRWFPSTAYGALTEQSLVGTANEPLDGLRHKLLFPRGVHMSPRGFGRDQGGGDDHGKGMAHKLTAQFADNNNWLALGPSVDHLVAASINPGTQGARRPPLNLLVGRPSGYKGLDFSSYSEAGRAVAGINNPWTAYSQFINLNNASGNSSAANDRLTRRRQSVLDLVQEQFNDLERQGLSVEDQRKLDAHFTAIRNFEIQAGASGLSCNNPTLLGQVQPYETLARSALEQNDRYPSVTDLQIDLLAMAMACDFTRVATLQFDRGSGGPTFRWDGMNHEYNHHKLSHGKVKDDCFGDSTENGCTNVAGYEDMLFAIDYWHQSKYARLLSRLDSYVEAGGRTLLDNSVVLYTNELSDGKAHSFMDLPYILAGSAGGYFKQGQYILLGSAQNTRGDDDTAPHNRLLNTVVNAMGIRSDWFGVAQGGGGQTMQGGVYDKLLA
ncbi:MAG TPA: DUF1552 domain-containing protein [Polyangiaceae bacterium]|nr:DUF1552 domain-containing protein [Polyangiaceae bacterium]